MKEQIDRLKLLETGYTPSLESVQSIESKRLLAFIGAFAAGKTTLMSKISETDERFSEVISFTTRPSRGEGDHYRFIDNTPEHIEQITTRAVMGDLINFAVHPTTHHVYGTEPNDYKTEFCMLATTANSFEASTGKLPFLSVDPVTIVANPDIWRDRISARSASGDEYRARIREAKQSLEWCLDLSEIHYIDNSSPNIAATASMFVRDVKSSESQQSKQARRVAERMLAHITSESK